MEAAQALVTPNTGPLAPASWAMRLAGALPMVIGTVMGGGRYTFNTSGKVVPYGQFVVGLVHCCGDTDFEPGLGFGVDVADLFRPGRSALHSGRR